MRLKPAFTICTFLFILLFTFARGGIYEYSRAKVSTTMENALIRIGMYSPADSPSNSAPGNGRSFVKYNVEFFDQDAKPNEGETNVYSVIFHTNSRDSIGILDEDDRRRVCCTPELFVQKKCSELGQLIINGNASDTFLPIVIPFYRNSSNPSANRDKVVIETQFDVQKSGVYYVYTVNCPGSGAEDIRISGDIEFMNPYGYLPGELFPYLPFYGTMGICYVLTGFFWLVLSLRHRRQLLNLQNWIAVVIVAGIIETVTLFFDHLGYNISGKNYVAAMIMGVIFSTFKRAISRILVLVVSMGYGVVKPTLGAEKNRVYLLCILYIIFSGAFNIVDLVERTSSSTFSIFLIFPVAVLDTVFYWWIFLSLLKTIQQLTVRKQSIKLSMYKWFFGTLVVSGVVSSVMIVIQLFVTMFNDYDKLWDSMWVWTAFWHVLYFVVLTAIAILWRPTQNNSRYGYSEMSQTEDDEVSLQPFPTLAMDVTQRPKKVDEDSINEVKLESLPSFSIDEDDKTNPQQKME